jgi:excisionase family DNA binding protein
VSSESETVFTPAEVAAMFGVDPKTVTRWTNNGQLKAFRTLGGHRRYRKSDLESLMPAPPVPAGETDEVSAVD